MKIAIVGSSHLSETEEIDARKNSGLVLNSLIKEYGVDDITLISGGAKGVDTEAEDVAKQLGIKTIIHKPLENNWEKGYKPRNLKIAQECDILYCFPTKVKTTPCYHCEIKDHEVTGGCWTMKHAEAFKKEVHIVPLI
jgi:hypothetical protein